MISIQIRPILLQFITFTNSIKIFFILLLLFLFACKESSYKHPGYDDPRDAPVRPIAPDRRLAPKVNIVRNPEPFPWYKGIDVIPSFPIKSRVWAPTPVGHLWDIVNFALATVHRIEENQVILRAGELEFTVPAAVLLPARISKNLPRGTPVVAAIGLTGEWAKVVENTDQGVVVQLVFAQDVVTRILTPDAVLPLDGKGPGSPVGILRQNKTIGFGMLVYIDHDTAGIIGYAGRFEQVPTKSIRFVSLDTQLKKNAFMFAPYTDQLEEVRILDVLANGVAATVFFVSRPEETGINPRVVSYARLTKMW